MWASDLLRASWGTRERRTETRPGQNHGSCDWDRQEKGDKNRVTHEGIWKQNDKQNKMRKRKLKMTCGVGGRDRDLRIICSGDRYSSLFNET